MWQWWPSLSTPERDSQEDINAAADDWIAANRDVLDPLIEAALAAA